MTSTVLKKPRFLLYVILTSLILLSNYFLYRTSIYDPIPEGAVLGSLLDLLIIIPLMTYILIIRKRYSLNYLGLVIFAAFAAAYFIVPNQHLSEYSFLPYVLLASEAAFMLFELYIAYTIITRLPKLLKEYRTLSKQSSFLLFNVKKAIEKHLPGNKAVLVFASEFSLFHYALFSWKKKIHTEEGQTFTYHQKTSSIAVNLMLIHAVAIESIGLHYFLHNWNEIVAYVLLFLNVYGILYFIAEIQATRLSPYLLTESHLLLQTGFSKSMHLPLNQIKEIKHYDGPEKFTSKELNELYDARVADFNPEKPTFEILLHEPQELHLMYGLKRKVTRIVLNVDEPARFYEQLKTALERSE
jgi:membrane protein YdbS with pleckstrin-like domain